MTCVSVLTVLAVLAWIAVLA
uniref:Uncharacterized protein n=1 Tax=Anguilla anguilla TaxID=7936 RepID=A0A0E9QGU5_ANGAN